MHPNTVALFPGQGSQHSGMGKELFENFRVAREVFEEASDAVRMDLKKLCFEGPDSELVLTENTQPCLLTASVAAYRVATSEFHYAPARVAGHSLGEYSALVAAGALPLAATVRWVRERGLAMQAAVPTGNGTMAAIMGLEDPQIEELCQRATQLAREKRSKGSVEDFKVEAVVEPANFNAPGQTVIAGSVDAVEEAIALIKAGTFGGGKAIPLSVSAPFHCSLMGKARDRMAGLFAQATQAETPRSPLCPYVPNRTARATAEKGVIFELLVEQVDHPVLWRQAITGLLTEGYTTYIEFGPGKVLSGLNKRISQKITDSCLSLQVNDLASLRVLETHFKGET